MYGSLKLFSLTTALTCNHFIVYDLGVNTSHCFYTQQKLVQRVVLFSSSLWVAGVISTNSELASFRFDVVEFLSFLFCDQIAAMSHGKDRKQFSQMR